MIIIIMGEEPTIISSLMILLCFFLQRIQITDGNPKGFSGAAQVTERFQRISIVAHFGLRRQRKCIKGHLTAQKLKRKIDSVGFLLMKQSSAQRFLKVCQL